MKTNRYQLFFLSVSCLAAAVSCQEREPWSGVQEEAVMTFYAQGEPSTKTVLHDHGGGYDVLWTPSESINVFCDRGGGKFVSSNQDTTGGTVTFVGTLKNVDNRGQHPYWAVSPYSEDYAFDGSSIETGLPPRQQAVEGGVREEYMLSMARSETPHLYFYNLYGFVSIGVYEDGIDKILFRGNNQEPLAGKIRAALDENGFPFVSGQLSVSREITLLPPEGETFINGGKYLIVCLPGSFEKGYTLDFYRKGELVSMKKIETKVVLGRAASADLFRELYSGGVIYRTEHDGKTYSIEGKREGMFAIRYWVTIDDRRIDIPGEFSLSSRLSPTRIGPAVAFDTESETLFFAITGMDNWGGPKGGKLCKVSASGAEVRDFDVGFYPTFRFDEGQKRLELHSYSGLFSYLDGCHYYIFYHDTEDDWIPQHFNDWVSIDSSGYRQKKLSDALLFFHEPEPVDRSPIPVDLGLSVKWADCNLGAVAPERFGDYYSWGETVTKKNYAWDQYNYYEGKGSYWGRDVPHYIYYNLGFYVPVFSKYNMADRKHVLDPEDDVAQVRLGGNWRMPTSEEWQELIDGCSWEWVTLNGVTGKKGTSLKNGNTIFLPAADCRDNDYLDVNHAGIYLSSSTDNGWRTTTQPDSYYMVGLEAAWFDENGFSTGYEYRWKGLPVRAVFDDMPHSGGNEGITPGDDIIM